MALLAYGLSCFASVILNVCFYALFWQNLILEVGNMKINNKAPVLVTGATGYVAGVLIKTLLAKGLTVHASVRDVKNRDKLKYLIELDEVSPGTIRFFEADLLEEGSYCEAMENCELVYHTASPFKINIEDAQKELIDPALLGTRNVLNTASTTSSVKRVVLTSSCAAIYGDNYDLKTLTQTLFTEEHWNMSSSMTHQAYSYSKTLAEKEAWRLYEAQKRWDLVVLNPSLVAGPGINPFGTSESFNLIKQFGDGRMKAGVPNFALGVVDVRDLAQAHYLLGFTSEAQGRHIISGHNTSLKQMASTLLDKFGDEYPIPKKLVPKWLVWLFGPLADKSVTRKMVSLNMNYPWLADNTKSKKLGVQYRPLAETMNDFFQQMVENQYFKK